MEQNINNEINIKENLNNEIEQQNFLETTLGKTINMGIDIGIRSLLPDYIEEEIIELKNNLFLYGLKDGIKKSIDDAISLGKSAVGVITGNFENIYQAQEVIKHGGIIDKISNVLDLAIDKANKNELINPLIAKTLKQGKNSILNNIEKNIENTFDRQIKALNYTEKYINNWKEYFKNKNFEGMEKEYEKIEKEIKQLIPFEKTINEARILKNLHNLIKNNGKNFDLTEAELELAEKLK